MNLLDYWKPIEVNGRRMMVRRYPPEGMTSEQWSEVINLWNELEEGTK